MREAPSPTYIAGDSPAALMSIVASDSVTVAVPFTTILFLETGELDAGISIRRAMIGKQTMPVDIIVGKSRFWAERKVLPTIERKIDRGEVLWSAGDAHG
ncbi:MAG: nucleotidyltransferase domain-containing protein [Treponematales bacterium]